MLPAFLITFREVIEASLIVATVLGILTKLKQTAAIKTVWYAAGFAGLLSFVLVGLGSLFGFRMSQLYSGRAEELTEGILMVTSAVFITWAVFFLHKYFSRHKIVLLKKIKDTVEKQEQKGLFLLVFTAVLREGFEIVLFLSTVYFSSNPQAVLSGFSGGVVAGILISLALFSATLRMPVYLAFRVTSALLILFAAGLLTRSVHAFAEAGILPEIGNMTFAFIPANSTFAGDMVKTVFGITQKMNFIQLMLYSGYISIMTWYVFFRNKGRVIKA